LVIAVIGVTTQGHVCAEQRIIGYRGAVMNINTIIALVSRPLHTTSQAISLAIGHHGHYCFPLAPRGPIMVVNTGGATVIIGHHCHWSCQASLVSVNNITQQANNKINIVISILLPRACRGNNTGSTRACVMPCDTLVNNQYHARARRRR